MRIGILAPSDYRKQKRKVSYFVLMVISMKCLVSLVLLHSTNVSLFKNDVEKNQNKKSWQQMSKRLFTADI